MSRIMKEDDSAIKSTRYAAMCYAAAAVVTAAGLFVGAWGLYSRSERMLLMMVASIGVYGLMRGVAWYFEDQALKLDTHVAAAAQDFTRYAAMCYAAAAVVTAAGLCLGAWGLYSRSQRMLVLMVASIGIYGLMRGLAWYFEDQVLKNPH